MTTPISSTSFREALANFASGVAVVTARGASGPAGFTATAFSSVSLSPPLVLVCVATSASVYGDLTAAPFFGVSVLAEPQRWVAEQFARRGVDRFQGVPLRVDGVVAPLIEGAIAQLECRPAARHRAGDHAILIGEVVGAKVAAGRPLLHFSHHFGSFVSDGVSRSHHAEPAAGAASSRSGA
jgi:flavin reductase ActVB